MQLQVDRSIWASFHHKVFEWGKAVLANEENLDKLSIPVMSNTRRLMAPFFFNHFWWYEKLWSELNKMMVGVNGMHDTFINLTGLVMDRIDCCWLYKPPVDTTQYMESVLPQYLDALGNKYEDIHNVVRGLNSSFWMSLAKCHQNRIQVGELMFMFQNYVRLDTIQSYQHSGIPKSLAYTK